MRNLNKKLISFTSLCAFAVGMTACQQQALQNPTSPTAHKEVAPAYVSPDWLIQAPEQKVEALSLSTSSRQEKTDLAVDAILDSHLTALDQIKDVDAQSTSILNDHKKPKDWVPWRMVTFTTELGVGFSGLIGTLTGRGTPSVQVFWERKAQTPAAPTPGPAPKPMAETPQSDDPGLVVSNETTSEELSQQLEPVVQSLVASGKVKDETQLRSSLSTYVQQFQVAMSGITNSPQTEWYLSRLRFDLQVTASGFVVVTWGTVAIDAKIRLEWLPSPKKLNPLARPVVRSANTDKLASNLGTFIQSFAKDLAAMSEGATVGCGYSLDEIQVGLGGSIKGDVGFAIGKVRPMAYAFFNKRAKPTPSPVTAGTDMVVVTGTDRLSSVTPADNVEVVSRDDSRKEAVVKIPNAALRSGLKKAIKMGAYFADRASRKGNTKWGISKIKTQVDMSLTGNTGLSTVSGDVFAQLVFKNMNF